MEHCITQIIVSFGKLYNPESTNLVLPIIQINVIFRSRSLYHLDHYENLEFFNSLLTYSRTLIKIIWIIVSFKSFGSLYYSDHLDHSDHWDIWIIVSFKTFGTLQHSDHSYHSGHCIIQIIWYIVSSRSLYHFDHCIIQIIWFIVSFRSLYH